MISDSVKVGKAIRERRLEAGLSQASLEELSGSGNEVVWQIEVGRTIPVQNTIWRLCGSLCFHRTEILKLIDSAKQQRKNRDQFKEEYAFTRAQRILDRIVSR